MSKLKHSYFHTKNYLLRATVRNTLSSLVDIDTCSESELATLNSSRRTTILKHAYDTTSFYREKYTRAGFKRSDLDAPDVLQNLPTLKRDEVRENFDNLISSEVSSLSIGRSATGGSTGTPLVVGTDPRHALEVISWRRLKYWGAHPADNSGYMYRVVPTGTSAGIRALFHYPTRRTYLSATDLNESSMSSFRTRLLEIKAQYLVGYVGALQIFAEYIEANRTPVPSLRFIWTTASPLPRSMRQYFERVFEVPVYSQYGSCEFYWIGSERKDRTGHDVEWDIRHVEVLDDSSLPQKHGEMGRLVVTDLINRAFPLIRYEIGDRSRFVSHPERGEVFPILDYVSGRVSDTITLKSGKKVPGEFWTTLFDDLTDQIRSFYVHQSSDYSITINFTPTEKWTDVSGQELLRKVGDIIGNTPVVLRVSTGNSLDRGKLKFVTSDVLPN